MADKQQQDQQPDTLFATKSSQPGSGKHLPLWATIAIVGAAASLVLVFLAIASR